MVSWKYIAQNVLTGEFLSMDLPLTTSGPVYELSAAGSLSATIAPQMRYIVPLEEWQTAIYAELNGEIRWGGLLHSIAPEGGTLNLEVAGFSSYPEGIPYTGPTYTGVGANPTQIFYDLWNHLQSQVDGDLGVTVIMPTPPCKATVGTTEEPYVLAPEEAPDVGGEMSQLAEDAPFEYVERHYWADLDSGLSETANPATATSWMVGYGNLEGGYNGTDSGGWMKNRAQDQADFILDMGVDMFAAVELHEEKSKDMPKGAHRYFEGLINKLNPAWKLSEGNGGNHLLVNTKVLSVLGVKNRSGIDDPTRGGSDNLRSTSTFTVQHLLSGAVSKVKVCHLHANDNNGASRANTREAEAKDIVKDVTNDPYLLIGDMNEWDMGSHDPPKIFANAGFLAIKDRLSGVPNASVNSSKSGSDGHWIEGIYTRTKDFDVSQAAGVGTDGLSDHQLWMKMRVTLRNSVVAVRRTQDFNPLRIRHEIVIGSPRLGRRRDDLAFVHGDNVISLVPVTRDGDNYANDVIGLGKGEGTGMVRTEVAQRDGRLRRPAVYTDKTADTVARLAAACTKEFAKRQLLPEIATITVQDHPNAPIGSWSLGDDILVQGRIPWVGDIAIWSKITGWSMAGEDRAILSLARSDVAAGAITGSLLSDPTQPSIDTTDTGDLSTVLAIFDQSVYDVAYYA